MRLSLGQEALYFEYQSNPLAVGQNEIGIWHIRSAVDVGALRRTFQHFIDRHDNCRTQFAFAESGVETVCAAHREVDFEVVDASGWTQTEVDDAIAAKLNRILDLSQDALFSIRLYSRSATDHYLCFFFHHIVVDGWSFWLFAEEFRTIYPAECRGESWTLPPAENGYDNHVREQRALMQGPKGDALKAYWRKKLDGVPVLLDLPCDFPRPPHEDQRGDSVVFTFPDELYQKLKALAASRRTTLYTLLLSAYEVFLYRYSGQNDFVVSSPVPGRNKTTERTIGYLANQIVLRAQPKAELSFDDFWAQTRTTVFGAYKNSACPFSVVARELAIERNPSRSPLAQVAFVFQKGHLFEEDSLVITPGSPGTIFDQGGLSVEAYMPPRKSCQIELSFVVAEVKGKLHANFFYQSALFHHRTVERFVAQMHALLESIVRDPAQSLSALNLLPKSEREELLQWSAAPRDYPREATLPELFAIAAKERPEAVALKDPKETWTYSELQRGSDAFAAQLATAGVRTESRVGLLAERSAATVAAILGIVRAGGAYVPIDLDYPVEQQLMILQDAECGVFVVQESILEKKPQLRAALGTHFHGKLVPLPPDAKAFAALTFTQTLPVLGPTIRAENLAALFYTSGTTGRSKGTEITHRAMVRLVKDSNYLSPTSADVFLQLASISFDAATLEIWGSLLNGGRLVIFPQELLSLENLDRVIRAEKVSVLFLTTGLFNRVADGKIDCLASVRCLMTGGSAMSADHARKVREKFPALVFYNIYGPTENTTFSSFHPLQPIESGASIPIGRTISRSTLYVLDERMQLAPVGVPGEIAVGGDGLARGYFHRPELTAEKFVPDSISGVAGARLYLTGDRGRYRFDGEVEFLGRWDHQVKIRGFRIELDGIESVLRGLAGVSDAIVLAKTEDNQTRLIANVVPEAGLTLDAEKLREALAAKLPPYMVPAAVSIWPQFPLTINGKVDRNALLAGSIDEVEATPPPQSREPRTESERKLAAIWCELLNVPSVGIDDNFFGLGGDSILVLSMVSRARTQGLGISVRVVLERQTIAAILDSKEDGTRTASNRELEEAEASRDQRVKQKRASVRAQGWRAPETESERILASVWSEVLHIDEIGLDDNYFGMGGDSLMALTIISKAQSRGLMVSLRAIMDHQTVGGICAHLAEDATGLPLVFGNEIDSPKTNEPREYPLHPTQQWFFDLNASAPNQWNMGCLWELTGSASWAHVSQAVQAVLEHHESLRTRFACNGGKWTAVYDPKITFSPLEKIDCSGVTGDALRERMTQAMRAVHQSHDIQKGAVVKVLYFDLGPDRPASLFWSIHHLVVDAVSLRILFEDTNQVLAQLTAGKPIALMPVTASAGFWVKQLHIWGESLPVPSLTEAHRSAAASLPLDEPCVAADNTIGSAATLNASLDVEETNVLLRQLSNVTGARIQDALTVAVVHVVSRFIGANEGLWIEMESHGRQSFHSSPDISRTVGWFTSLCPTYLPAPKQEDWIKSLQTVRDHLRAGVQDGFRAAAVRLARGRDALPAVQPELSLNYLGRLEDEGVAGQSLRWSELSQQDTFAAESKRTHWWDLSAFVRDGKLEIHWAYARAAHREETIARLLEEVRVELREMIAKCRSAAAISGGTNTPISTSLLSVDSVSSRSGKSYPLSYEQEQLWFIHQLDPGLTAYNVPIGLRLKGAFDSARFNRALEQVVRRHEVLRSVYFLEDNGVRQVVDDEAMAELKVIALSATTTEERLTEATRHMSGEGLVAFDLRRAPVILAQLYPLGPDDHLLFLQMHHIAADGWSSGVLTRELAALYSGLRTDPEFSLPPLLMQYGEFAVWQRDYLSGDRLRQLNHYWMKQLQDVTITELPWDFPRPRVQTFAGGTVRFSIRSEIITALREMAREANGSLYMALLAAFQVLLHRYSGQEDLVIGSPYANRSNQTEALIGCFVNMIVLRTRFQGRDSFRELLQATRKVASEAYVHQELPFEKLVTQIDVERDMSRNPLVQVIFALQNALGKQAEWEGLNAEIFFHSADVTRLDFECHVIESGDGAEGIFTYNASLFKRETVERMSHHWQVLLESLVAQPDLPINRLPMIDATERQRIFSISKPHELTVADGPRETGTLTSLLEAAAVRHADRIAVEFEEEKLSFREVHERANRLAHYLVSEFGIGPEKKVGVLMRRSPAALVAFLAVQKAGGVYVPLDPDYPPERIDFLARDSGPVVILTGDDNSLELPSESRLLTWSEAQALSRSCPSTPPLSRMNAGHASYIIYTSGTTGRPKGVVVPHGTIFNTIQALQREYGFDAGSRILHFSSLSFDASLVELAGTLISGATLVIGRKSTTAPGTPLLQFLRANRVTHLPITPSALAFMSQETELPELQVVIAAGESLPQVLAERWKKRVRLINGYGPTEATICATVAQNWREEAPPIGMPITNAEVYVLDTNMEPVPVGIPGEVYVGGAGVTRGYLNRPDLTAERFIPNPFSGDGGARLYRTGDQARWRDDGQLEFLGRVDRQIKLLGFRIEPAEIETILTEQPGVRAAAVLAIEDEDSIGMLTAFVAVGILPPEERKVLVARLTAELRQRLPSYLVPGLILPLEELPQTPNGKVDEAQLRRLAAVPVEPGEFIAPRSAMEQHIAAAWAEELGVRQVSRDDNFFALGGHSLLAMRMIGRLQEMLSVDVETVLRTFFSTSTLGDFCEALESLRQASNVPAATAIQAGPQQESYPLSYAQQRLWFLEQMFPGQTAYHSPVAIRFDRELSAEAVRQAIQQVVDRHSSLRTRFATRDGGAAQIVELHATLPFETRAWDGKGDAPQWIQTQAHDFLRVPIPITGVPLVKALWLELGAAESVLVCSVHHICIDGWSVSIFAQELLENLNSVLAENSVERAALAIDYCDFAAWERSPEQESRWLASTEHWRKELVDFEPLRLPNDGESGEVLGDSGRQEIFVPLRTLEALRKIGREKNASLFMTLLAAFEALLGQWSGQEKFVIGTGVANRNQKELQSLIGFFVNSLVLPADISGDPDFAALVSRTRDRVLTAFAHQELPFERLVQELQPERTLRNPLFQVAFLLQETPPDKFVFDRFTAAPFVLDWTTTRLDCELHLYEMTDGLRGMLCYDRSLFSAATMERIAHHFVHLLEEVVAHPTDPLSALEVMESEERKLAQEWSGAGDKSAPSKSILTVWADAVRQFAERPALQCGERCLSYAELDAMSNRLARFLADKGVGRESRVALLMERNPETIAAMLAVLKAGGAYVPMDPSHPMDRLRWMIDDVEPLIVVTDKAVEWRTDFYTLNWQAAFAASENYDATALPLRAEAPNLAYLIYTSGSTGQPKGVEVTHGNLGHIALALAAAYDVKAESSVVQLASLTFDASVAEIFMAFAAGARLVMSAAVEKLVGASLLEFVQRERITHLQITPSALAVLPHGEMPDLTALIVVGEAFPRELADAWRGAHLLINGYGPTEGTICATCSREWRVKTAPPIGRPIPGVQVYLLDAHLRSVPIGTPGEIYIGGHGVARGYWQRRELSAERFVPDSLSGADGARLYRTGDMGRWREDGQLEFIGRVDEQIKINGQRIELGEIAATLREHAAVRDAAVTVSAGANQSPTLVGYVVPRLEAESLGSEQVSGWQHLYDEMMEQTPREAASTFDITGWNSVYTGEPLGAEVMSEWQAGITGQIRALQPRRVLEIGCGSGLMLFPVAPQCESYWATDFSQATLNRLATALQQEGLKQVRLWHRTADQWDDFVDDGFDTVVLNSVVQYFPTLDYLRKVLSEAVRVVEPGGRIFIGDVRSLELQEMLYASVELSRATDGMTREDFHRRVLARLEREEELVISPAFFRQLADGSGAKRLRVEIRPRTGTAHELAKFRYDVVIHVATEVMTERFSERVWSPEIEASLAADQATWSWSCGNTDAATVGEWRKRLDTAPKRVDVETRRDWLAEVSRVGRALSNHPLHNKSREQLTTLLREHLRGKLPAYMIPAHFVLLEQMPLTTAGKIDWRRLPKPVVLSAMEGSLGGKAHDPMEDLVASIYAEVLGIEVVGRDDSFFELGGHSLLAYSLIEKLRQRTGRQLALAHFFTEPTVRQVATNLARQEGEMAWSPLVPIQTAGKEVPFFCVAPIMGTVFPYFELARALGPNQPFYGLQPRGLDGKQSPHTTAEAMAADFVEAIRTVQPRGPYKVGGWSFGAMVAFEIARQLEAAGETVEMVVSLDGALNTKQPISFLFFLKLAFWSMTSMLRQTIPYMIDYFYLLSESARQRKGGGWRAWGGLFSRAAAARVVPQESRLLLVEQPFLPGMMKVFAANMLALKKYHATTIQAPLVLIYSTEAPAGMLSLNSWKGMTRSISIPVAAPGDHMTLLRAPHVTEVAAQLRRYLGGAVREASVEAISNLKSEISEKG